jgi:DNA repair protein SbcD/Mre11
MRASFIHVADTHLGNEQYGVHARFNDFSQTFWDIMKDAAERAVDFVVIAGDLFHKRSINPLTLIHAVEGLKTLKEKGIPVIAIEGNHDRSYFREGTSWLQFLCYQGYLTLLDPRMEDGAPLLEPWTKEHMQGAYIDLLGGKLRVYGLKWHGASTVQSMKGLAKGLNAAQEEERAAGIEYRLLMMHTGVDGIVPRMPGLPMPGDFEPFKQHIDYLALGHVHKPFEIGNWIYNPGSTETCGAEEAAWEDRGYYHVEIDTDMPDINAQAKRHRATHLTSKRRPFVRHDLRVDGLNEPNELYARLEDYCRCEGPRHQNHEKSPLVQVQLIGTLAFDAGSLDNAHMEELVHTHFNPLHVRIDNNTNDRDYLPETDGLDGRDRSTWHELERRIFEDLVGRDSRYLPAREQWGSVLVQLKTIALEKQDPAQIAQFLREKREALLES